MISAEFSVQRYAHHSIILLVFEFTVVLIQFLVSNYSQHKCGAKLFLEYEIHGFLNVRGSLHFNMICRVALAVDRKWYKTIDSPAISCFFSHS